MFFIAFIGLTLVALTISGFLGDYWWPLDLIANFRPQLGVAGLVAGLWLLAARWQRTGWIVLAGAAVNLALLGWLWVPPGGEPPADAEPLRVISFNVLGSNTNFNGVIDFLAEMDADVVFLHEASRPWEEAMIASDLGYRVETSRSPDNIFGTLVLVRPGAEIQSFGFNQGEPRSVEVRLRTFGGREVALLGIHPLAPTTEQRAGLRDAQVRYAAQWAARQDVPTVVTGDFNAGPWSHAFYRLLDEGGLQNSQRGFGLDASFPASSNVAFRIAIDHLTYANDVWVVDRTLGPALGSDHFPLIVDLAIG